MIRILLLLCTLAWPVTRTHQDLIDLVGRKGDITHLYDLYSRTGYLSAAEFGAVGNGAANDSAAIRAAIIATHEYRVDAGLSTATLYLPPGIYKACQVPIITGLRLVSSGRGGAILTCSDTVPAVISAVYSAGSFTSNLAATQSQVQNGTHSVENAALENLTIEHTGALGSSFSGAIQIVGAPTIEIMNVRGTMTSNNRNFLYLKYCWRARLQRLYVNRGGAAGGVGIFLDSECNAVKVDQPFVYGPWTYGIRSTNPNSVSIIEPNVETCSTGILLSGKSGRIIGGYLEGNIRSDIQIGVVGAAQAQNFLVQNVWHNPIPGVSKYAVALHNGKRGRVIMPFFEADYDTAFFYSASAGDGNVGNVIELATGSDASTVGIAALGLSGGRNLVKFMAEDHDDYRFQAQYRTSDNARVDRVISGIGAPEGAVPAPVGFIYVRADGGAGTTLYVKESGTGTLGWVAK